MAKRKLEDVLALVPLFRGLSKRQLKHVASYCQVADYMEDHSLVREGEPGDAFFIILAGQATVTIGHRVVNQLVPGDHFGEIALLDGGPRSATVKSVTPMTVGILYRKDFVDALRDDPDLSLQLMRELAGMVRRIGKIGSS